MSTIKCAIKGYLKVLIKLSFDFQRHNIFHNIIWDFTVS